MVGCGQQGSEVPAGSAPQQEQATEAPAAEAPAAEATAPGPVTFTDDAGNEVTVDNPQRVVACMGSFANAWELAGGTLVGVSDDALQAAGWTIQSPDVATVGDFSAVNLEAIMALNPDFVIMTSGTGGRGGDSSQADLRDALIGAGIGLVVAKAVYGKFTKKPRVRIIQMLDLACVFFLLGQCIGRIGCYFGKCCYGIAVDFDVFPFSYEVHGVLHLVHEHARGDRE